MSTPAVPAVFPANHKTPADLYKKGPGLLRVLFYFKNRWVAADIMRCLAVQAKAVGPYSMAAVACCFFRFLHHRCA